MTQSLPSESDGKGKENTIIGHWKNTFLLSSLKVAEY